MILIFNFIFNAKIDAKRGTMQAFQTIRVYSESCEFGLFDDQHENSITLINIGIKF